MKKRRIKVPKQKFHVRNCEDMSLLGDSNVNWGYAVQRWTYARLDYADIAWFPFEENAVEYIKLLEGTISNF